MSDHMSDDGAIITEYLAELDEGQAASADEAIAAFARRGHERASEGPRGPGWQPMAPGAWNVGCLYCGASLALQEQRAVWVGPEARRPCPAALRFFVWRGVNREAPP